MSRLWQLHLSPCHWYPVYPCGVSKASFKRSSYTISSHVPLGAARTSIPRGCTTSCAIATVDILITLQLNGQCHQCTKFAIQFSGEARHPFQTTEWRATPALSCGGDAKLASNLIRVVHTVLAVFRGGRHELQHMHASTWTPKKQALLQRFWVAAEVCCSPNLGKFTVYYWCHATWPCPGVRSRLIISLTIGSLSHFISE